MGYGIEVYSRAGNLIFSSAWGHSRILGRFNPNSATGSRKVTNVDGTPVQKVFAYITPFSAFIGGSVSSSNAVWCVGDVIYWRALSNPNALIVYGDGYA